MASYLSQRGYEVNIYEKRQDMRIHEQSAGRSINLALSKRGIDSLKDIGLYDKVRSKMLPMAGRMIHDIDGKQHMQRYGQKNNEVIYSISRSFLNKVLIDHAESKPNVQIFFNQKLIEVELNKSKLIFNEERKIVPFEILFGSDGSASPVRNSMEEISSINFRKIPLDHGYKEINMPPDLAGNYRMDPNALHIWPRGNFMLIALPNTDHSFTCTLFFPMLGELSFSSIDSENKIIEFFKMQFPDIIEMLPNLVEDYKNNPTGKLATVYCDKWNYKGKALIFGDAAHAIVPFFGQGMNASFQDCKVIDQMIEKYEGDWNEVFSNFTKNHKPNGHAIANMALENYIEMRDLVNDEGYIKKRELELKLELEFPNRFLPRYSMVSFHSLPYSEVYKRGEIQSKLMDEFLAGKINQQELKGKILKKLEPIL